jgi:phospholipase C
LTDPRIRAAILGGEAFLARVYNAYKAMQSPDGSNVWNTALLIGWDEPGGTYDHVPPPSVPPPDPSAPAGQDGFTFDRSGYRVPAIIVSPWVAEGEVFNEEHRHTSLIATLREQWGLGDPFTARDAAARTFSHVFTLDTPRDPATWPVPDPRPVPAFMEDPAALGASLSTLGKTLAQGIREYAEQNHVEIEGLPKDPKADLPPEQVLPVLRNFLATIFPLLAPAPDSGTAT